MPNNMINTFPKTIFPLIIFEWLTDCLEQVAILSCGDWNYISKICVKISQKSTHKRSYFNSSNILFYWWNMNIKNTGMEVRKLNLKNSQ